jgi:hypothetical protein
MLEPTLEGGPAPSRGQVDFTLNEFITNYIIPFTTLKLT